MNIIEQLGLEKCKQIVGGAPEWANYWITRDRYHFHIISFPNMTGHSSYLLSDIRTAITEHDLREEFEKAYSEKNPGDKCTLMANGNYSGWIKQSNWDVWKSKRLKKACGEDSCTAIRNHISPNTKVIER